MWHYTKLDIFIMNTRKVASLLSKLFKGLTILTGLGIIGIICNKKFMDR